MNLQLYTAEDAAEEVGVKTTTIYTWVRRGILRHAAQQGRMKLFRLDDVFEAEKTRDHKRRKRSAA